MSLEGGGVETHDYEPVEQLVFLQQLLHRLVVLLLKHKLRLDYRIKARHLS